MQTVESGKDDYEGIVKKNAIATLYDNMGLSATALSIFPLVVLYSLWGEAQTTILIAWFIAAMSVAVLRWLLYANRQRVALYTSQGKLWVVIAVSLSLSTGVIWGMSAPLFLSQASAGSLVILTIIVVGLAAGSAISFNYWLPHFFAFAVPVLSLFGLYFLFRGGDSGTILAFMVGVYLFMLGLLARKMNHSYRYTLMLRLKNEALVDELRLEKDLAESASRAKTRFLASASHDLRQPVHSISLLREAMEQEKDAIRRKELLGLMGNSLDALNQLLGSLLDISRLDAGVIESKSEPMPLKPLLDALLNEVQPLAWGKGLKLRQCKCNHNVISDHNLLVNILRNLITNAIRYTEKGGVLVGCRKHGQRLWVQIWDTGIGIAKKDQENIFQEFTQLHNQERDRNKGLGLGLAICRRMASLLGHELYVKSRPGRGSVFTVELPLYEGSYNKVEKTRTTYSHWDLYGKRVLVLDDDDTVREGMLALLQRWGCVTVPAADGDEAIRKAREADYHFDVIVSDYRLPNDTTGVEVVKNILTESPIAIPVILVTGDTSPERIKEAKESGFPLLHKPVKPAFLRNAMGKAFAPKGAVAKLREEGAD